MPIFQLQNKKPILDESVFIAYNADIIGDVKIGKKSSVWFKSIARGDLDSITIGKMTNIQDLSMLHLDRGVPLSIGNNVTVGHRCVLHGCTIEDYCLIGMSATILSGAKIGTGSIVAAGAVVLENTNIPPYSLVTGVPAKIKTTLDKSIIEKIKLPAIHYAENAKIYASKDFYNPGTYL